VVAAALTDDDGRILLQRRRPGKAMAGLWEFPGGKVEEGESPETALIRELEEELGVETFAEDLEPVAFASAPVGDRPMILLLYRCRRWRREPRPLDASALVWLTPEEMRPDDMPPADGPLVDTLRRAVQAAGSVQPLT